MTKSWHIKISFTSHRFICSVRSLKVKKDQQLHLALRMLRRTDMFIEQLSCLHMLISFRSFPFSSSTSNSCLTSNGMILCWFMRCGWNWTSSCILVIIKYLRRYVWQPQQLSRLLKHWRNRWACAQSPSPSCTTPLWRLVESKLVVINV